MGIWKPTSAECRAIRAYAQRAAGCGRVKIEPGERTLLDVPIVDNVTNMNVLLVTKLTDDSWDDTDLFDHRDWKEFQRGVDLTDDGRAIVDFYIYSTGYHGELETNIQVYFENGRVVRMCQTLGRDARDDELPQYDNDVTTLRKNVSRWF